MAKKAELELIGKKIRSIRESKNFTQDDVAYEAGLSRSYYSGIERGVRNVASLNLIRIAIALNVEVGELFPSLQKLRKLSK